MLEILYRIYQVPETKEEQNEILNRDISFGLFSSTSKANNIELVMDCLVCDSREQFKEIIKDTYGDIPFRYSKNFKEGQLYCIIIGEHAYDVEKYFDKVTFKCDYCGAEVTTYIKHPIKLKDWEIKDRLCNIQEYAKKRFCSEDCKFRYIEQERSNLIIDDELSENIWINRDSFTNQSLSGYIYKITKKSTGEFYVGQTIYIPIFRWGQHLKTERFPVKNILDYKFEVIELVPKNENILEREKYWIQKCYNEDPNKSLNIMQTQELRKQ